MKLLYSVDNPHNQTMIYEHNEHKFRMRLSHEDNRSPSLAIMIADGAWSTIETSVTLDIAWESYNFGEGNTKYTKNETIENNRVIDAFKKYIEAVY